MKFTRTSFATLLSIAAIAIATLYGGCNNPHSPWNKNPWPPKGERGHGRSTPKPRPESIPQDSVEDFCEDMRDSIEQYRSYLEDESLSERRRDNIRNLVEQYDRECLENQQ